MNELLIIALNCKDTFEFENCDFYNDSEYSNNLDFFIKLNRIGIKVRETEMRNGRDYKCICFIDCLKYDISKFSKNWLYAFTTNTELSVKDLYSDNVQADVDIIRSKLSYSLVITNSIPFNFISNFYRFEKALKELANIDNRNSAFYTFCIHQKLRLLNYNTSNRIEKKLI